jgi:hypothetical protein
MDDDRGQIRQFGRRNCAKVFVVAALHSDF